MKPMKKLNIGNESFEVVDESARNDVATKASAADVNVLSSRMGNFIDAAVPSEVTTLWTGTMDTLNQSVTLSESVLNFDFLDIYTTDQHRRVPVSAGSAEMHVANLSDDASSNFLHVGEIQLSFSGTTATLSKATAWIWTPSSGNPTVDHQVVADIKRIDGVKIEHNAVDGELADVRVGYDGTTYANAGDAVRGQFDDLKDDLNAISENTYFYEPSMSWEVGTIGSDGQPTGSGNYRQRTTDYVKVLQNKSIWFSIPRWCYIWVYQYDATKNFMPGLVNDWIGATSADQNGMIEFMPNAKTRYIKLVIRCLSAYGGSEVSVATGVQSSNVHLMQIVNDKTNTKLTNIPFYTGSMVDYTNLTNVYNPSSRANTNFIPVSGRHAFYTIPAGYQAYVWELDEDFQYVIERGWISGKWYYYLNEATKYIRLVVKADNGSSTPDKDVLKSDTVIEFKENIDKIPVNPIMMSNVLLAHRGYAVNAPENTLPAIELAHQNGYKMVEVDLQFTSDGVCVLLHDNTIDRTSNGTGSIFNMTYQEALQYDFGSWKSADYAGTKIPTLKEALLLCKYYGMCLQLDIADLNKTNITSGNLQTMIDDIKACGMLGSVNVCCYENRARALVSMQNGINIALGIGDSVANAPKLSDLANACSLMIGSNQTTIQSDAMMEYCHTNGLMYQIWTINTSSTANSNYKKGVDWIITDNLKPSDLS